MVVVALVCMLVVAGLAALAGLLARLLARIALALALLLFTLLLLTLLLLALLLRRVLVLIVVLLVHGFLSAFAGDGHHGRRYRGNASRNAGVAGPNYLNLLVFRNFSDALDGDFQALGIGLQEGFEGRRVEIGDRRL